MCKDYVILSLLDRKRHKGMDLDELFDASIGYKNVFNNEREVYKVFLMNISLGLIVFNTTNNKVLITSDGILQLKKIRSSFR